MPFVQQDLKPRNFLSEESDFVLRLHPPAVELVLLLTQTLYFDLLLPYQVQLAFIIVFLVFQLELNLLDSFLVILEQVEIHLILVHLLLQNSDLMLILVDDLAPLLPQSRRLDRLVVAAPGFQIFNLHVVQQTLQFLPLTAFVFQNRQDFLVVFVRVVQFHPPLVEKLVLLRLDRSVHDRLLQLDPERQGGRNVFYQHVFLLVHLLYCLRGFILSHLNSIFN